MHALAAVVLGRVGIAIQIEQGWRSTFKLTVAYRSIRVFGTLHACHYFNNLSFLDFQFLFKSIPGTANRLAGTKSTRGSVTC